MHFTKYWTLKHQNWKLNSWRVKHDKQSTIYSNLNLSQSIFAINHLSLLKLLNWNLKRLLILDHIRFVKHLIRHR